MKKTYTEKQIREAIRYWEKQLKQMDESENFKTGRDGEDLFEFTADTTHEDIIGWICKLYGCKDGSDLYNTLVSDKVETWDGKQTAVDDCDQFRASQQDMIREDAFLDNLAEEINDVYSEDQVVQGSDFRKTVDAAAEKILADAFQNFDYSDCQTYSGRRDMYY